MPPWPPLAVADLPGPCLCDNTPGKENNSGSEGNGHYRLLLSLLGPHEASRDVILAELVRCDRVNNVPTKDFPSPA